MAHQPVTQAARPINYRALNEVLLLGGIAALFLIKWLRGQLDFYIHPRYTALIVVSAVILLLMAGVRLRGIFAERAAGPVGWVYVFLALPLLLGTLVPAQPLGANTLASRGGEPSSAINLVNRQTIATGDSSGWNLLEWSVTLSTSDGELEGKPVDVVGFVFQDDVLGANHFYVARYVVTCCAADGVSVGMPVLWEGGEALSADSWVRVRGTLSSTLVAGVEQPAIAATSVEPVSQPKNPYLYP